MGKGKKKNNSRFSEKIKSHETDIIDDYEPTDSDDDDVEKTGKILLNRSTGKRSKDEDSEEEVLGVLSSSSDEDETNFYGDGVPSDFDSDVDDKDNDDDDVNLKAWGKNKDVFYDTDYIDKDYGGMSKQEEELAEMEEEEAKNIQKRLFAEIESPDFSLGLFDLVEKKKAEMEKKSDAADEEKVSTDLSKMSKQEKIELLKQESPILFRIAEDFKSKMELARSVLVPITDLKKKDKFPKCVASDFVEMYYGVVLNYCTNIVFFFVLRASQRGNLDSHPVTHRLQTYKKIIDEMDIVMSNGLLDRLKTILKKAEEKSLVVVKSAPTPAPSGNRAERRKRKHMMLKEEKKMEQLIETKKAKLAAAPNESVPETPLSDFESSSEEEAKNDANEFPEDESTEISKRSITFQMSKNKGLTPRRKKENRNPRVKNKNKYRKAVIRRKGQVRNVRTEVQRYGGELSGIKAYVSKSVKFKN